MAVFRVEKTRDYTVMSNYHLKDKGLTLKSKGLLSMMLSLPDDWNYTTRGLAAICKEGVDSIGSALRELEQAGYIIRTQLHDVRGRMADTEYVIYEQPQYKPGTAHPSTAPPDTETPCTENPYTVKPCTENPAQLNTYRSSKHPPKNKKSNIQGANPYPSNPNQSLPATGGERDAGWERTGRDEAKKYREIVRENIEYDVLRSDPKADRKRLDEIVELMVETLCSTKPTICFGGGALIGVPLFFLLKGRTGVSTAAIVMILSMLPFFLLAMYEKNGQPLEKALNDIVQTLFVRPKRRPYKTDNFYAILERQAILDKEVEAIVRKNQDARKKPHARRAQANRGGH